MKADIGKWRKEINQIKNNKEEPQSISVAEFLNSLGENKPEQLAEDFYRQYGGSLNRAGSLIRKRRDTSGKLPTRNFMKQIFENGNSRATAGKLATLLGLEVEEAKKLTSGDSLPDTILQKLSQPKIVKSLLNEFPKLKQEHMTATLLAHRLNIPLVSGKS